MTAVIIAIVLIILIWLIAQGVLLTMLWGQQQRSQVRADVLRQFVGLSNESTDLVTGRGLRASLQDTLTLSGQSSPPALSVDDPVLEPAPVSVPEPPPVLTFPPPLRREHPVPSARVPSPPPVQSSVAMNAREGSVPGSEPDMPGGRAGAFTGENPRTGEEWERSGSGLGPGAVIPDFELKTLDGALFRRTSLAGKRAVLLFLAPGSPGSSAVLESIRSPQVRKRSLPDLVLVLNGGTEPDSLRRWIGRLPKRVMVLVQEDSELATALRVPGTPAAYVLDEEGRTRGLLRTGARAVLECLGISAGQMTATARRSTSLTPHTLITQRTFSGLAVGSAVPAEPIPLIGGGVWEPGTGRTTLMIFWDADCPPCEAMVDQLAASAPGWTGFDPVVVTRGAGDLSVVMDKLARQMPVARQHGFDVARRFQVLEAPAAVAIAADGTIARPPAIGAAAVFALAKELEQRAFRTAASRGEAPER